MVLPLFPLQRRCADELTLLCWPAECESEQSVYVHWQYN